jgi:hypothetical protein
MQGLSVIRLGLARLARLLLLLGLACTVGAVCFVWHYSYSS